MADTHPGPSWRGPSEDPSVRHGPDGSDVAVEDTGPSGNGGRGRGPLHPEEDEDTDELPLLTRLNERGFRLVMLLDYLALMGVLIGYMTIRFGTDWPPGPNPLTNPYTPLDYGLAFLVLTLVHLLMFYFGGLYEREPRIGGPPALPRVARLSAGAIVVFTAANFALSGRLEGRALPVPTQNLVVLFLVGSAVVSLNRWLVRRNRVRNVGKPRVLLVGAPDEVNVAKRHLLEEQDRVELAGDVSSTDRLMERVDASRATDVILLSSRWLESMYPALIREFERRDIGVLQRVSARETLFGLERVRQVGGMPFVPLKEHTLALSRVRFKRSLEVAFLLVLAPVLLPVMGILVLYQLIVAGRPVFFWQTRVGRDGVPFEMVKFRTMVPEAEEDGAPRLASRDDPRIIAACRWLRATRLDELPQMWNVLKGEMSIVGPRPERPELTAQFEELIPGYSTRYEIPPGITGLAQVHGHYSTDPEYKLGYDLQYLVNWSPLLDLEILARTAWVILARRI